MRDYNHEDPIFYRQGPIDESKYQSIKKCPSCRYQFTSRREMVYCTFCGLSNDEKCMKRTRYFPMSPIDQNTKLHTARGPICKLCVHKFYVHEEVCKAIKTINGAKI